MHPLYGASSCAVRAGEGYTQFCDRTVVHVCAFSLKYLAVAQDIHEHVSISVEQSW